MRAIVILTLLCGVLKAEDTTTDLMVRARENDSLQDEVFRLIRAHAHLEELSKGVSKVVTLRKELETVLDAIVATSNLVRKGQHVPKGEYADLREKAIKLTADLTQACVDEQNEDESHAATKEFQEQLKSYQDTKKAMTKAITVDVSPWVALAQAVVFRSATFAPPQFDYIGQRAIPFLH